MLNILEDEITSIKNIGAQRANLLKRIGVTKIKHLLLSFPTKFITESSQLFPGPILINVRVLKKQKLGMLASISTVFELKNSTTNDQTTQTFHNTREKQIPITLKFFNAKAFNFFQVNNSYKIFGTLEETKSGWEIKNPKIISNKSFENLGAASQKILPVYSSSISNIVLNKIVNEILGDINEFSEPVLHGLSLKQALWNLHNGFELKKSQEVLKFIEASLFVHLFGKKETHEKLHMKINPDLFDLFHFKLTQEQLSVVESILSDLQSAFPMKHFVYAEVGAGKTAIAFLSAVAMIENGYNVAFLAPTITLAQQHYNNFTKILEKRGISHILLSRNTKKKEKEAIKEGKYQFVIATHALLFCDVPNLGLVVIDEIQKFGVLQKAKLLDKAVRKNVLMMSATPIPRSLNILLSNFIHFSIIQNSVFKKKITTTTLEMNRMHDLIARIGQNPQKTYWVMPAIEDTEDYKGAVSRADYLSQDCKFNEVFLLHGKMKDAEKIEVVEQFKKSQAGILVATTVIEIGIDIPDANRIIIENANQFGLAQLHQLRGRVGRSGQEAFCVCLFQKKDDEKNSTTAQCSKKLQYFKEFSDGFSIAQKDMELRGSGEWVGVQQHGTTHFSFLKLPEDEDIFEYAQKENRVLNEFAFFINQDIAY